jgi:hypothetical protein
MAAPIRTCTKVEQRCVIRFLISEGVKPIEVHHPHHQIQRSSGRSHLQGRLCWLSFGTNEVYSWSTTGLGGTLSHVHPYSDLLKNHLRPAVRSKRRGRLTRGVLLQHDNARPHTARATVATIKDLHFERLPHSTYSPDLAQSDYHS